MLSRMTRRRFLTRSALAAGTVAGAGTFLDACNTSSSTTSSSGGGKTTLTVMYNNNELTPAYITEFEKLNPDLTIKFIEYDATRLNAMLAAGTPPDFVRGAAVGSAQGNARGLALALDSYLEKSKVLRKDDLLPINDSWRWNGKVSGQGPYYGISKDWSLDATLWYNEDLFKQAGISSLSSTEPMTYDQLLTIGKKLTATQGGKTKVYGLGVEWDWGVDGQILAMIKQQGASLYTNANYSEVDFTQPAAKNALQWYVEFMTAGIGPSSLNPLADGQDAPSFLANRMAVTQDGYWFGGNVFTATSTLKTGSRLAPAPQMGSNRYSPCFAGIGAWIPAASKHKDEAWRLMEYFMTGTPAHDRAKSGWGIPSLKSFMSQMPQDLPYQQEAYASTQNELTYSGILPDSPYISIGNYDTILKKYLLQVVKKQITLDAACQQATADANKLLAQGKAQIG
jgi:multiple sugar transport system substrate-binding protein